MTNEPNASEWRQAIDAYFDVDAVERRARELASTRTAPSTTQGELNATDVLREVGDAFKALYAANISREMQAVIIAAKDAGVPYTGPVVMYQVQEALHTLESWNRNNP